MGWQTGARASSPVAAAVAGIAPVHPQPTHLGVAHVGRGHKRLVPPSHAQPQALAGLQQHRVGGQQGGDGNGRGREAYRVSWPTPGWRLWFSPRLLLQFQLSAPGRSGTSRTPCRTSTWVHAVFQAAWRTCDVRAQVLRWMCLVADLRDLAVLLKLTKGTRSVGIHRETMHEHFKPSSMCAEEDAYSRKP